MKQYVSELRRRLLMSIVEASQAESPSSTADTARVVGFLFVAAAALAGLAVALTQPEQVDYPMLVGVLCCAALTGAAMLAFARRLPHWAIPVSMTLGTILITVGLYARGPETSIYAMFYLWAVVVAFFFLHLRDAVLQAALVAVAFALLLGIEGPPAAVESWIVASGTVAVTAVALTLMRQRVNALVGDLRKSVSQLEETARTDPLTGLLNRRGFEELMEAEIERGHRGARPMSLLIGDVDHFKRLNDTHGHLAGDRALRRLATTLESSKRKIDTVARIGGEEFAIVAPETDKHGGYVLAENIRARLSAYSEVHEGLTLSFGVATFPGDGEDPRSLMHSADQALYVAKELGRDTSVVYKADVATDALRRRRGGSAEGEGHAAAVLLLAHILDVREGGSSRHSERVAELAVAIGGELSLAAERLERLRIAGLVHDIGTLGLPDAILGKPGPLSEQEQADLRKHPERGAEILRGPELDDVRGWVLAHHERLDGGGYPLGLTADDIPLEARIVAVAEAYDAMTTERTFKPRAASIVALRELRRASGTQFDPRVVDALARVLGTGGGDLDHAPRTSEWRRLGSLET